MSTQLRDLRPEDKERLLIWRNRPEVNRYMYTDHQISPEEHERWFRAALTDRTRRYWMIEVDGKDVGLVNLYDINEWNRRCSWAYYLGEEGLRGKGIGTLVEYLVLSQVFESMGMNKLCCEVLATNMPVVELHKGFGFREEGLFRQHVVKGGRPLDVHFLAMLREEWLEMKPRLMERVRAAEQRRTQIAS